MKDDLHEESRGQPQNKEKNKFTSRGMSAACRRASDTSKGKEKGKKNVYSNEGKTKKKLQGEKDGPTV